MLPELNILYEDKDILVCIKPAGMPCESDSMRDFDLLNLVKNHLAFSNKENFCNNSQKYENHVPYAALLHRLDRPVGGIMLFAKNRMAAARLSEDIKAHSQGEDALFEKEYAAVLVRNKLNGAPCPEPDGQWHNLFDYIDSDKKSNTSYITDNKAPQAKPASLSYCITDSRTLLLPSLSPEELCLSLAEIKLKTGRHHQIRLQTQSHLGGIWGDRKYNPLFQKKLNLKALQSEFEEKDAGNAPFCRVGDLALFACRLTFLHPVSREKMCFEAVPDTSIFPIYDSSVKSHPTLRACTKVRE